MLVVPAGHAGALASLGRAGERLAADTLVGEGAAGRSEDRRDGVEPECVQVAGDERGRP